MSTATAEQTHTMPSAGSICWLEIPAANVSKCKAFYASLFPAWDWKSPTEGYGEDKVAMFTLPGKSGLTGGIVNIPADCKAGHEMKLGLGVTVYHMVESINDTKTRVEELGGRALGGKNDEGTHGWYMYCADVEGNRFGIYEVKK